jgi:DNA (cytosine-5)-methyltransferase 1
MRVFSTFSGIGGFEKGITAAIGEKAEFIAYSEIDKYASSVYEKQFKGVPNYGDITKIKAEELPDFDCLVGGFPCQAFSIAGKRAGFNDTRGTLFFDLARILRAKQPRLFVFENVKGLLSHDGGKTFKTIIEAIDELGYDVQWQIINSKNHGVPQNRERVYIVGHLRGTPRPEVFPISGTNSPDTFIRTIRAGGAGSFTERHARDIIQLNQPTHSNDRVYGADGISPTLNTMQGGNRQPFVKVPEATKKGYAEATVGDAINLTAINSKTRRGRVSNIAPTVDTGMQLHTLTEDVRIRRLTPIECERLQGFPDNWTAIGKDGENISDTQRYKMAGNAVTTNVVQAVFERIFNNYEEL